MTKIRIRLRERSYDILIGCGLIGRSGVIIKKINAGRDAIVVTNKKTSGLYGKKLKNSLVKSGISVKFELVPDSEQAKSGSILIRLLNRTGAYDKNRSLFMIALGGGVIGDLTGFAASVYKRGVPYIQIPTTLLAQVDSAIGGKTAIDLPIAKNLAGAFYQPKAVISDTHLLRTLSGRQVKNGLAECIKYGIIKDKKLFEYLESNYKKVLNREENAITRVVLSSSKIKARIVEEDELDKKGARAILNYGHTIGHAIEAASSYSKIYNHGEAVAIGMVIANRISSHLGLISDGDACRIESLIEKCGLPTRIKGLKFSAIYDAHLRDKKFIRGKNRFVLPVCIGKVRLVAGIENSVITEAIKYFME